MDVGILENVIDVVTMTRMPIVFHCFYSLGFQECQVKVMEAAKVAEAVVWAEMWCWRVGQYQ